MKTAILTVSDKGAKGERVDVSGATVRDILEKNGYQVRVCGIVPDEIDLIQERLKEWCDRLKIPLVVTTGGTGLSERDVTPEATKGILDREVPGIGEAMRTAGIAKTPFAILSRGTAGIRGKSLIINLPGNPKAVQENLDAVLPVLNHAIKKMLGDPEDCADIREKV